MGTETIDNNKETSTNNTTVNEEPKQLLQKEIVGCDVDFIPISISHDNVIDGASKILEVIRPNWIIDNIKFKLFTDGITNKLVGCFYEPVPPIELNQVNEINETNTDQQQKSEVILVRIYGNKTDLLIDRRAELKNIQRLHIYGFSPKLHGVFCNGLAYEYIPGCTLSTESVHGENVWPLIARHMARMHKLKLKNEAVLVVDDDVENQSKNQPMLWNKMQKFFDLIPDQFSNADKHERVKDQFLPVQNLRNEFSNLFEQLKQLNSPVVFCHNDLLLGNVIYTESKNSVSFIDFEYADYNYQAYDIGNHFTEFAGIDNIDYNRYPTKEFQLEWLRIYLETYTDRQDISDDELNKLYIQTNIFALASHFFWAVWALIQAEHSNIDFDFVLFAQTRYNEYLARKDEFLSLKQ